MSVSHVVFSSSFCRLLIATGTERTCGGGGRSTHSPPMDTDTGAHFLFSTSIVKRQQEGEEGMESQHTEKLLCRCTTVGNGAKREAEKKRRVERQSSSPMTTEASTVTVTALASELVC